MEDETNSLNAQRADVLCAITIIYLEMKADTKSKCYSNANLRKLSETKTGVWQSTASQVYVQPNSTEMYITLQNEEDDEVHIHYALTNDFHKACYALAGYLSCFSRPIDEVFPVPLRKTSEGLIALETAAESAAPKALEVYHNIFVRIELSESRRTKSTTSSYSQFNDLRGKLRDCIHKGLVKTQKETLLPRVGEVQAPKSVTAGKPFDVEIDVDVQDFYEVICQDDVSLAMHIKSARLLISLMFANITSLQNLIYANYVDTKSSRKYTFLAVNPGEGTIDFCFAHHRTLNFNSKRVQVTIHEP